CAVYVPVWVEDCDRVSPFRHPLFTEGWDCGLACPKKVPWSWRCVTGRGCSVSLLLVWFGTSYSSLIVGVSCFRAGYYGRVSCYRKGPHWNPWPGPRARGRFPEGREGLIGRGGWLWEDHLLRPVSVQGRYTLR